MKKNLRLLCLGLAAATFTCSFAQEDYTDRLTNADMEQGLRGWGFSGVTLLGKNSKDPAAKPGFYGMNKGVLEAWNANVEKPLDEGYVMQRLSGLPNGTYVFGAYAGASKQDHRKGTKVAIAPGDSIIKYDYWSNRDAIYGVQLFANDSAVRVATNNPDWNGMFKESHSSKFNVAVVLSDADEKKGYLDVGIRYANTNANYVVWDNATLYYFGGMSASDALDAMAKIDVKNAIDVADTLKKEVMNSDTLVALTEMLAAVKLDDVNAANLEEVNSEIFWTAGLARKSITDYANLEKNIKSAQEIAAGAWSDKWKENGFAERLAETLAEAEAAYAAKKMNREELTALRTELNWRAGDLKMDSVDGAQGYLAAFITSATPLIGRDGGYTKEQIAYLEQLNGELSDTIEAWSLDCLNEEEEIKAAEDRTVNPNNLFSYVALVYEAVEEVKNNPIDASAAWSMTLPQTKTAIGGYMPLAGSIEVDKGYEYTSPLIEFPETTNYVRLTVSKVASNQIYFCLGSMEFFDAEGNEIPLTAADIYSNADHNSFGSSDGQSYEGLVDDNPETYFHSKWSDEGKINGESVDHYLEVTLPNDGYDAVYFKIVARGNGQRHQFPGEIIVTVPASEAERDNLKEWLNVAKGKNPYSIPEPGFYVQEFNDLIAEINKVEAALEGDPSEVECKALADDLKKAIDKFEQDLMRNAAIYLPEAGKQYRIVSAHPGFYEKQQVEKALTVHLADSTLWWENLCADSAKQVFEFEPIMVDGEHFQPEKDGVTLYAYRIKNVAMKFYVDSAFIDNKIKVVKEPLADTILLKNLGRGQWNIMLRGNMLHAGDHASGTVGGSGAYGGTYGVSSGICAWSSGIDDASAWFIREMPALPLEVLVKAGEFKSEFIHFDAANTITLTADKDCAFEDLALYDLYGAPIAIDSVVVSGKTATIIQEVNLVGCSFAFDNNEGVASVQFDAYYYIAPIELLQAAYDKAVAVAPEQGTDIGLYADITAYTEALEAAEAILDGGAADEEKIDAAILRLEEAVDGLVVNMPEEGKYYFIYSAVANFEKNKGYRMALYAGTDDMPKWGHENYLDWKRYWQFERATKEELKAAGMDTLACAYYIRNIAEDLYIAEGNAGLTDDKEAALPYVVTVLGVGSDVALDGLGQTGKRLHANNHGSGAGNGSNIVYWNAGAGSASAWNIVEAQYDVTDIDFTEVETEQAVVKGTYDLFGRRVVAPTAPGIYIIEGKKRLVK